MGFSVRNALSTMKMQLIAVVFARIVIGMNLRGLIPNDIDI